MIMGIFSLSKERNFLLLGNKCVGSEAELKSSVQGALQARLRGLGSLAAASFCVVSHWAAHRNPL
jgi:hypothetical protein